MQSRRHPDEARRPARMAWALLSCVFVFAAVRPLPFVGVETLLAQEKAGTTAVDAPAPTSQAGSPGAGGTGTSGIGTSGGETEAEEHPDTYLEFAMAGGTLMIPIALFSLLLATFFVERLWATRRNRVVPAPFLEGFHEAMGADVLDLDGLQRLCAANPSTATAILSVAIDSVDEPRELLDEAVNHVARREVQQLRRNSRFFAVIAAVAPLLGLLGTVTGMIQAFRQVAIQGLGSGQALAPGIYKALVTTAGGLLVAIPALLIYHWLMSRVDYNVRELDDIVVEFVQTYRRQTKRQRDGTQGGRGEGEDEDSPRTSTPAV